MYSSVVEYLVAAAARDTHHGHRLASHEPSKIPSLVSGASLGHAPPPLNSPLVY